MPNRTPWHRRRGSARARSRWGARHNRCVRRPCSVAPDQPREASLDLHSARIVALCLVLPVSWVEADHIALAAEGLERRFLIVDEGHYNLTIVRGVDFADQGEIAVENAFLDHRIAGDLERIMLAGAEQSGGHGEAFGALKRLDRSTGGDPSLERDPD